MRKSRIDHVEELTHPATCPECGKRFEIRFVEDYVFKVKHNGCREKTDFWCSYHCWKAMQDRKEQQAPRGENYVEYRQGAKREEAKRMFRQPIDQGVKDRIVELYKQGGRTLKQIGDEAGVSAWFVARHLEKVGLHKKTRRCSAWHRG